MWTPTHTGSRKRKFGSLPSNLKRRDLNRAGRPKANKSSFLVDYIKQHGLQLSQLAGASPVQDETRSPSSRQRRRKQSKSPLVKHIQDHAEAVEQGIPLSPSKNSSRIVQSELDDVDNNERDEQMSRLKVQLPEAVEQQNDRKDLLANSDNLMCDTGSANLFLDCSHLQEETGSSSRVVNFNRQERLSRHLHVGGADEEASGEVGNSLTFSSQRSESTTEGLAFGTNDVRRPSPESSQIRFDWDAFGRATSSPKMPSADFYEAGLDMADSNARENMLSLSRSSNIQHLSGPLPIRSRRSQAYDVANGTNRRQGENSKNWSRRSSSGQGPAPTHSHGSRQAGQTMGDAADEGSHVPSNLQEPIQTARSPEKTIAQVPSHPTQTAMRKEWVRAHDQLFQRRSDERHGPSHLLEREPSHSNTDHSERTERPRVNTVDEICLVYQGQPQNLSCRDQELPRDQRSCNDGIINSSHPGNSLESHSGSELIDASADDTIVRADSNCGLPASTHIRESSPMVLIAKGMEEPKSDSTMGSGMNTDSHISIPVVSHEVGLSTLRSSDLSMSSQSSSVDRDSVDTSLLSPNALMDGSSKKRKRRYSGSDFLTIKRAALSGQKGDVDSQNDQLKLRAGQQTAQGFNANLITSGTGNLFLESAQSKNGDLTLAKFGTEDDPFLSVLNEFRLVNHQSRAKSVPNSRVKTGQTRSAAEKLPSVLQMKIKASKGRSSSRVSSAELRNAQRQQFMLSLSSNPPLPSKRNSGRSKIQAIARPKSMATSTSKNGSSGCNSLPKHQSVYPKTTARLSTEDSGEPYQKTGSTNDKQESVCSPNGLYCSCGIRIYPPAVTMQFKKGCVPMTRSNTRQRDKEFNTYGSGNVSLNQNGQYADERHTPGKHLVKKPDVARISRDSKAAVPEITDQMNYADANTNDSRSNESEPQTPGGITLPSRDNNNVTSPDESFLRRWTKPLLSSLWSYPPGESKRRSRP